MGDLFLIILALIWLVMASIQDIKRREVDNWLSFSLITFSSAYVIFYSLYYHNLSYFLANVLGLGIFIALGFLFYYGRVFAGGDAKLIMGLGIILSSSVIISSLENYFYFIFLLLLSGAVYGLFYSLFIALSAKQAFFSQLKINFKEYKKQVVIFTILGLISLVVPIYFQYNILFLYPLLILISPFLLIYGRAVEQCLIKLTPYSKVTVGDWLYKKVKINNKTISPHWEGLTEAQVALIKKHRKNVVIKNGIPFVPAFLIAFILFLLWNSHLKFW